MTYADMSSATITPPVRVESTAVTGRPAVNPIKTIAKATATIPHDERYTRRRAPADESEMASLMSSVTARTAW
jgi:hypothetical protein